MATNKKGGGLGSAQVREVGVRNGTPAREMRPRGVSQYGSSMGNHVTETGKKAKAAAERVPGRTLPAGLSVPLGNAVALNVGRGGPGTGRKNYGQSGSQCVSGPVNPGVPGLPSTKGQWPD
jgi:hypothetical protein